MGWTYEKFDPIAGSWRVLYTIILFVLRQRLSVQNAQWEEKVVRIAIKSAAWLNAKDEMPGLKWHTRVV